MKEQQQAHEKRLSQKKISLVSGINRNSGRVWGGSQSKPIGSSQSKSFAQIQAEQMYHPVPVKETSSALIFGNPESIFNKNETVIPGILGNEHSTSTTISNISKPWRTEHPRPCVRSFAEIQKEASIRTELIPDETNAWGVDDCMLTSSFVTSCVKREESKRISQVHPAKPTIRMIAPNEDDSEWKLVTSQRQGRKTRKVSSQNRKFTSSAGGAWGGDSFAAKISKPAIQRIKSETQPNIIPTSFVATKNKQTSQPVLNRKWSTPQLQQSNLRAIQSNEQKKMKERLGVETTNITWNSNTNTALKGSASRPESLLSSPNAKLKSKNKIKKSSFTESNRSSMTPQFKKWCETEMMKLTGNSELTLVDFLMTVEDPSKVRAYVRHYMASKDGYEEFTNRFLLERDFARENKQQFKKKKGGKTKNQKQLSKTLIDSSLGAFGALAVSKAPSNTVKKTRRKNKKQTKN